MHVESMDIDDLWQYVNASEALSGWGIKPVEKMRELVSDSVIHALLLNAAAYAQWKDSDPRKRYHHASVFGREIIRAGRVSARALQGGERLTVAAENTLKNGNEYIPIPRESIAKYGPAATYTTIVEPKSLSREERGLLDEWDDQLCSLLPGLEKADEVIAHVVEEARQRDISSHIDGSLRYIVDETLKIATSLELTEDGVKIHVESGESFGESLPDDVQEYALKRAEQRGLFQNSPDVSRQTRMGM